MSADPNADSGRQERLNQILLQHDDRLAAGETTPTLEEYIRLHPDLAGELRAYFQEDSQFKKKTVLLRVLAGSGDGDELPLRSFGKYEVLRTEAVGGMGVVVRAVDLVVKREVVLKVMKKDGLANPELVRRFRLEGQLLGQLAHPAIVPLHEMGETPDERKLLYLAMKLVRGHTLDWLLKRRESTEVRREQFLEIFVQVCRAVAYAHSKRVLHRDLKASNVMVGEHEEVQLTDFGLAKFLGAHEGAAGSALVVPVAGAGDATRIDAAPGTPAYMAPEQARGSGDTLDERCDVFGLGGILCEILTAEPPRTTADLGLLLRDRTDPHGASLVGAYERLTRCGGPAPLVDLCRQCLAYDPKDRPAGAKAVAEAVLAYRAGLAQAARDKELEAMAANVRADAALKRQKLAYGLAAALLLLLVSTVLLAGVGGLAWSIHSRRQAEMAHLEDETAGAVNQRVQEWKTLRAKARAAPVVDIEQLLKDAHEQAQEADAQARRGPASETVRQLAKDTLADADTEVADAAKDRRVTARLLEMMVFGDSSGSGGSPAGIVPSGLFDADRRFAEIFQEWGLDPDRVPVTEAAARIRKRPPAVATELIAALDYWAYLRRLHLADSAQRLFDLANAADQPDPHRQELRELLASSQPPGTGGTMLNRERVKALADKVDWSAEPTLTLLLLAHALAEIGDQEKPITGLTTAAYARPRDALLWAQLGQLHCVLGGQELGQQAARKLPGGQPGAAAPKDDGKEPVNHFQQAVTCATVLTSQRPEGRFMLATALLYTDRDRGVKMLRQLRQQRPNDPDLQYLLDSIEIENLFLQAKLPEAAEAIQKITRHRKDDASHALRLLAAMIHLREGEWAKAEELCDEICGTAKSPLVLAGAYELLGIAKFGQRQEAEAIKAFGESLRYSQGIPSGHVYLAQKAEELKNLDAANQALTAGLQDDPKNAALILYAVEFYRRQGKEDEALAIQQRLPQADLPADARSLFTLASGLMRIKEYKLAATALRKHLKLEPDHTAAKQMLRKAEELQRSQKP